MEKVFLLAQQARKIAKLKEKIESSLNVKLKIEKENIVIEGSALDELIVSKVIEAISLGFDFDIALRLKDENYILEKINIKKQVRPSRLRQIKARIIGSKGKAKKTMEELTNCSIVLNKNIVTVLGKIEDVNNATRALLSLIRGSPHSKVYSFLERARKERKEEKI